MNEVELIRAQLSVERRHAVEVAEACASALWATVAANDTNAGLQDFRQCSVDYLVWILVRFEEREQVFRDLAHSRFEADDPTRRAVDDALALAGTSRDVLTNFEAALASASAALSENGADPLWNQFLELLRGSWRSRRDTLDRLFESHAKVTDWRAVSGIDADSIFEERSRYARVRATLPAGIEMPPATERV